MNKRLLPFLLFFIIVSRSAFSFSPATKLFAEDKLSTKGKKWLVGATHTVGYGVSLYGLSSVWYSDFEKTSFHLFDDSDEWGGMDKLGHVNTAWNIANASNAMLNYTGCNKKKSALLSSSYSLLYLSTLELFDAYSKDWGFSLYDMGANLTGVTLAYLRNRGILRDFHMKFGWTNSIYPPYRPELLGNTIPENILKDYNAQTYWMSINLPKRLFSDTAQNWICLSLGYSIDGYTGGKKNSYDPSLVNPPNFKRTSEFYFSIDIDFSKLPIQSKALRRILKVFNVIKIPAPAIGFTSDGKFLLKPLYF